MSQDIRRRVRSYFTSAEQRPRMTEMVGIATEVTAIVCATDLEARVGTMADRRVETSYNRRSRAPGTHRLAQADIRRRTQVVGGGAVTDDETSGRVYAGPYRAGPTRRRRPRRSPRRQACVRTQRLRPDQCAAGCVLTDWALRRPVMGSYRPRRTPVSRPLRAR